MPTYMKAYRLADLQRYPKWRTAAPRTPAAAAAEPPLSPDSIVYLREDRVVVRDCFDGAEVLFASPDDAWARFCREELGFEVADWEAESLRIRERAAPPRQA